MGNVRTSSETATRKLRRSRRLHIQLPDHRQNEPQRNRRLGAASPVHLRSLNLQTQQPSAAPCQSSRQPSLEGGRVNLDLAGGIDEPISAETTPTDPLNLSLEKVLET